jgi:hypothetical protein
MSTGTAGPAVVLLRIFNENPRNQHAMRAASW